MDIVLAPDPRLRVATKLVSKISNGLLKIANEMIKVTKTYTDPEGVGLASTQIGRSEKMFVMKMKDNNFRIVFNPEILSFGKRKKVFFEGCLSIPDYYGEVKRPTTIKVRYENGHGSISTQNLTGLEAWIFQHECEHLEGRLFVDQVLEQKSRMFKVVGKDRAGADIFEEVKL